MNKVQRKKIENIYSQLDALSEELDELKSEEEEKIDMMPENLQNSERFENMQYACEALESAVDNIAEALGDLEELF